MPLYCLVIREVRVRFTIWLPPNQFQRHLQRLWLRYPQGPTANSVRSPVWMVGVGHALFSQVDDIPPEVIDSDLLDISRQSSGP